MRRLGCIALLIFQSVMIPRVWPGRITLSHRAWKISRAMQPRRRMRENLEAQGSTVNRKIGCYERIVPFHVVLVTPPPVK